MVNADGKSTFVNLILRLFDLKSGEILIDDQNISLITQDSLRKQIAVIPQDPFLFHRSIFENIVIDLSQPYMSEELLTAFDFSSVVCLVMTPDIITFEHTQKFLDLMKDLSFDSSKFQIVLNMMGVSKTELDVDTLESYMERMNYIHQKLIG